MTALPFHNASIRTKMSILLVCVSGTILIVCCTFFAIREINNIRSSMSARLSTLASVVGTNCAASLRFQYPTETAQVLESLKHQNHVLGAQVYDSQGNAFAAYSIDQRSPLPDKAPALSEGTRNGQYFDVHLPIVEEGERLGSILIRASWADAYEQQADIVRIAASALAVSLLLSYLVALVLQRMISRPILNLVQVTDRVTQQDDYSVRAERMSGDEIGVLTDAFNAMLEQIESHRNHLEELVQERTKSLEAKTQEALAANVAKTEFLANMSHEIRTPMTAILGFTEVLLQDPKVRQIIPEHADDLQTIKRNGEHLIEIINDILDISKIEAGRLELEAVRFSPWQIIVDVVSLMRVRADAKGLNLELHADGPIPETIVSDPTRLRQILINLTGNAIKFTEVGGVKILVTYVPEPKDKTHLRIAVTDTGVGMTADQQQRLFQPFSQGDSSMTRRFGGTGLGLAISKRLTEMLGGTITVESRPNKGTTFTVTVRTGPMENVRLIPAPTETSADPEPFKEAEESSKLDCRILLAEDGPDNQRLITFHLRKAGAQVEVAENGQIAVEKALEQRYRKFDIILMDMQMPVLDGYAATAMLRKECYTGPIIALTAHAMAGDREKCLAAGCNDYVSKPIDRAHLLATIKRCLGQPV